MERGIEGKLIEQKVAPADMIGEIRWVKSEAVTWGLASFWFASKKPKGCVRKMLK